MVKTCSVDWIVMWHRASFLGERSGAGCFVGVEHRQEDMLIKGGMSGQ